MLLHHFFSGETAQALHRRTDIIDIANQIHRPNHIAGMIRQQPVPCFTLAQGFAVTLTLQTNRYQRANIAE